MADSKYWERYSQAPMLFWGLVSILVMTSAWRTELRQCEAARRECEERRGECEQALERVPPATFKRIYDELAECRQHLEATDTHRRS